MRFSDWKFGVGHRHGREQGLGVGVGRVAVQIRLHPLLDDLPQIHHGHAVRDVTDHGEIVGDEDVGQVELVLDVLEQIDHLGLHRHIEGGHRLVTDDDARVEGQGPGHPDPLPLPARELVGVAVDVVGVEPHQLQELANPVSHLVLGEQAAVDRPGLGDDVPTVILGLSEAYGSWKMIWICRRSSRRSPLSNEKMSVPL